MVCRIEIEHGKLFLLWRNPLHGDVQFGLQRLLLLVKLDCRVCQSQPVSQQPNSLGRQH